MIEPRMYVKKCFSDLVVKYGSIFGKDKIMTDKQIIIIDGVDVSGCEFYKHTLKREASPKWCIATHINYGDGCRYKGHCYNFPYCSYKMNKRLNEPVTTKDKKEDLKVKIKQLSKIVECSYDENKRRHEQLKAKEQEYEELRQYHNKCCEEFEKEKKEWLEKFNQISIGFYNGDYCNTEHCSLLKAKEQECEELKIYIESNEQQVKEVETLVMDNDRLINELDQLKAENEELKQFLSKEPLATQALQSAYSSYKKRSDVFYEMVKQYKQTLAEIKEIAEWHTTKADSEDVQEDMKQILQKISEVENG